MTSFDPESRGERQQPAGLKHLAALSYLLDRAFRIPGTQWRFGLDALIGLVPGLGDVVGSLVGAYSLWIARRLGAPAAVQARMVMNLAIDGIVGLVPFLGDLFDFAFKANSRNQALLVQWLQSPHQTRRSSWVVLAAGLVVLLALLGGAVWILVSAVQWVVALMHA
jgi:Domain of unknown function (DUF4112)